MIPHVMFGFHSLFGDYTDMIHARGGILSRVVLNVAEPPRPEGQRFDDHLKRYGAWLAGQDLPQTVEVIRLEDYGSRKNEICVLGFRGLKVLPLVEILRQQHDLRFEPLVHPTASVSPMAQLEEGVFVGAGAVVGSHAHIGAFSLINRGATIGHDVRIETGVVVGPSAATASGVRLCSGCVLGLGSTVIENVVVGEGAVVATGAVVLKDVSAHRMVAGVPAVNKDAWTGN